VYCYFLYAGRGARHPVTGTSLPSTGTQQWLVLLGVLLIWYNDPTFAVNLISASFIASVRWPRAPRRVPLLP